MRVYYNTCIIWPEVCIICNYRLYVIVSRSGRVGQVGSVKLFQSLSVKSVKSVRFGQSVPSHVGLGLMKSAAVESCRLKSTALSALNVHLGLY